MNKEVNYLTVFPAIRPMCHLYVPDSRKPPENLGNAHEKFTKRATRRMNQFRIGMKVTFVICVG